jgi:hypothetical protein
MCDRFTKIIYSSVKQLPLDVVSIVSDYAREYSFLKEYKEKTTSCDIIKEYVDKINGYPNCELAVKSRVKTFDGGFMTKFAILAITSVSLFKRYICLEGNRRKISLLP